MKLFCIALLLMTVRASELIRAEMIPQSLNTRSSFYGGWPIAATSCPSNTTSCGDGSCCPSSTDCYTQGLAGVAVCCPDTNNCANTVSTLPVCADASWTLYIGNYDYFCCAAGQIGILPNKGSSVAAGLCVDSSVSPAASVRATTYGAAGPTTAAPSSSIPSATSTTPSTTGPTSTQSSTTKPSSNSSPTSGSSSMSAKSSSTTLTTSSTSQPSNSTSGSTSKTGAIAGGVVGGVVVLSLIVLAIWFFRFRRWRTRAITTAETSDAAWPSAKHATVGNHELNEIPGPTAGNFGYSEMAAPQVLPGREGNFTSARISPSELA